MTEETPQIRRLVAQKLNMRYAMEIRFELDDSIDQSFKIDNILKKINEFGTTIVLVTHNRDVVNHLRRRVVTLHDGQVVHDSHSGKYVI